MKLQTVILFSLYGLVVNARLLQKCYDAHGCANCGGYLWCEEMQKCLRYWEDPCNDYGENASDYMLKMMDNNI